MKRLLFLLTLMMGLGCFNLYAQSDKKDQTAKAQSVRKAVQSQRYIIYCDRIYPQRGSSRYVGGNYSLEIKGDTLRSYLPYIGVAHSANYGGGSVLNFESTCSDYEFKEERKGKLLVSFTTENENEPIKYSLTIFTNGKADIHVQPMRRDAVSFSGELDLERKKK